MRLLLALGGALALAGCAASKERVTLLAPVQEDKAVGAVAVEYEEGETYLVAPNQQARLRGERAPQIKQLDEDDPFHRELMSNLPRLAVRELFYFGLDEGTLSDEELDRLQVWLAENIIDRPGMQIEIAAHTDATGTEEINDTLSKQRADNVLGQVRSRIASGQIDVNEDDIDVVASSWHWARSGLAEGQAAEPDRRYRVVVVTVR